MRPLNPPRTTTQQLATGGATGVRFIFVLTARAHSQRDRRRRFGRRESCRRRQTTEAASPLPVPEIVRHPRGFGRNGKTRLLPRLKIVQTMPSAHAPSTCRLRSDGAVSELEATSGGRIMLVKVESGLRVGQRMLYSRRSAAAFFCSRHVLKFATNLCSMHTIGSTRSTDV